MVKYFQLLTLLPLLICNSSETLASTNTSLVSYIATTSGNLAYIALVNSPNMPACAGQNRYIIDISSNGGKTMFSTALAAKAAGAQITIAGAGVCIFLPGDAENVNNIIYQ